MSAEPRRFEVAGPLPDRSMALEASAGTGKTWTLASLAVRYLAEREVALPEVLMVTFTRAATAELRERVRLRIAEAIREASSALDDPTWHSSDPVLDRVVGDALRTGVPELQARLGRLEAAAQQLDEATISTIHGFCQRMLQHAALEAGVDFDAVLLEDDHQLVTELVDDHLARALRHAEEDWARYLRQVAGIGRDRLATLARAVTRLPALRLLPDHPPDGDPLAGWQQAVEHFRRTWEAGGRQEAIELVGRLATDGAFAQPRQRTFTAASAAVRAGDVDAWLAARHRVPPGRLDPKKPVHNQPAYPMAYFTAAALASKLAEDVVPPEHPVLADAAMLLGQVTVPATLFLQQAARYLWDELDRRKRQRTVLTFDDLLARLADALEDDVSRDAVRAAIRQRYRVALIDEFQDTDAVQWRIFSSLFATDEPFVLIGDPKQAIYAFRGADIHTYLRARDSRPERRTLEVNFRSDASYVAACNTLFGAAGAFATPEISYRPIEAHQLDRLHDPAGAAALQLRYVGRDAGPHATGAGGPALLPKGWIDRQLPGDVAHEVVELLEGGLEIEGTGPDGRTGRRRLVPRDLAVLVRTNRRADAVQRALRAAGVPAVIQRGGSVFATAEAEALQRLLDAMLRPGNDRLASAAAASMFFGRDAATLVALREELVNGSGSPRPAASWDDWIEALTRWGERWQRDGALAAVRQAFAEDGVEERLLGGPAGDRRLTNVRHLVELLHAAESSDDVHPSGLAEWLRARRADAADGELPTVESELRLEEDAEAVRVVTVHGSKGLQYPVVLCPDLWDGRIRLDEAVTRYHDPDVHDPRHAVALDVDVDRTSPGKRRSVGLAREAELREQLRLAYVALTRAEHRCIVWWGPFRDAPTSALASLLHGDAGAGREAGPARGAAADDPAMRLQRAADRLGADDELLIADLEELGARAAGSIGSQVLTTFRAGARWDPPPAGTAGLEARRFTRRIDLRWRRTSFTALAHEIARRADPGPVGDDDRDGDADTRSPDPEVAGGGPSSGEVPLARFPRGAGPGNFLHDVLERLDFQAHDDAALPTLLAGLEPRHGIPASHRAAAVMGLRAALTTPLGPAAGGVRLADLARADRLDELRFELPLGIGSRGTGFSWSALAETAERSGDELLQAYARRLRDPATAAAPPPIRGYLTGSIDLLARLPDGRFLVADYKSNWLGDRATGRSTVEDYRLAALEAAMVDHHYVLQGLLYLVATHRYLRWRVPGYRYDTHVAGAGYLFLRGMVGPETPATDGVPNGVAVLRPHASVIEELSARFDEVRP